MYELLLLIGLILLLGGGLVWLALDVYDKLEANKRELEKLKKKQSS